MVNNRKTSTRKPAKRTAVAKSETPALPRDLIAEMCSMVRDAGGTVRLYGQAVTADDLRRVAEEIVDDKLRQLKEHVAEQIERRAIAGATAARHAVRDAASEET